MSRADEVFINKLKSLQVQHAVDNLKTPLGRDAFEYGRVCGFYQGLVLAEKLYLELLDEKPTK